MSENNKIEVTPINGNVEVTVSEARRLLKEHDNKVSNGDIDAFVCLKDINKIYPNGVQAVYDFNIDIEEHDFIVLVGPSGCGKSTTLRMVAGLEDITSGYLYINKVLSNYLASKDRDISMVFQSYALYPQMTVFDNIAFPLRARTYRKARKSDALEAVTQIRNYLDNNVELLVDALNKSINKEFKFASACDFVETMLKVNNVAARLLINNKADILQGVYDSVNNQLIALEEKEKLSLEKAGLTIDEDFNLLKDGEVIYVNRKLNKSEIREKVFDAARILDLGPYLDRRPKELSGGQMQRVALGRAIVRDARLFLMDEPLSNLDAKLRVQMRSEIVRIHNQIGATTIYVTHDQTEAMTMATKIAVMSKGWVQQIGTPQEIYNNPKNIFVATFIGSPAMNIVEANYNNGYVEFENGYKIRMKDEFVQAHDKYYADRIADLKRMLAQDDFIKMHALLVLDDMIKNHSDRADELGSILKQIKDEHGENAVIFFDQFNEDHENKHLHEIRRELLTFTKISSTDLGKLHNAQVFSKDTVVVQDTLHYQKRKDKPKKKKVNNNLNSTNVEFVNNLYEVATNLLAKYEEAVAKKYHPVRFGIRPENIHLEQECVVSNKSDTITIHSDIVELMGSELLIHTKWNDATFISKISTGTLVKPNTDVNITLDLDKIYVFDAYCGDTIR